NFALCRALDRFRPTPDGIHAELMPVLLNRNLDLVDDVDLPVGVAGQIRTQVEDEDELEFRLRRVVQPRDYRVDKFGRREILVLEVDEALGIDDRALVGFEDAGFAVW